MQLPAARDAAQRSANRTGLPLEEDYATASSDKLLSTDDADDPQIAIRMELAGNDRRAETLHDGSICVNLRHLRIKT